MLSRPQQCKRFPFARRVPTHHLGAKVTPPQNQFTFAFMVRELLKGFQDSEFEWVANGETMTIQVCCVMG